jgi:hypothetical protein
LFWRGFVDEKEEEEEEEEVKEEVKEEEGGKSISISILFSLYEK